MLFPTVEFALFFALIFPLSWAMRDRVWGRKIVLLVSSYGFYAFWDYRFVLLLAETSVVNYLLGRYLDTMKSERARKILLAVGIAFNLCVLGFFKYWGFFLSNVTTVLQGLGLGRELPMWEIILPMGISFFTFQGISYVVDVYRREFKATKSLVDVLLYISFFPQLVAGPIIRAKDFLPALKRPQGLKGVRFTYAMILISIGLFKKMVVAHYVATLIVEPVFANPASYSSLDLVLGAYGYGVQIYCDFSAYSDIAIGLAALLGFHFSKNFDQPYRAASISDFWRRWHISLSGWLRDYLYIPLGGNRRGHLKTYRNLMITMVLGGLWHGASWTFVIWGILHGGALGVTRYLKEKGWNPRLFHYERIFLTFNFVCFAWIFFNSPSLADAFTYISGFANISKEATMLTGPVLGFLFLGMVGQFVPGDSLERLEQWFDRLPAPALGAAAAMAVVIICAVGPGALAPFIYFQF